MEIIFFAAISLFIFLKLRSQLGKISDEEKQQIEAKIKAQKEKIIQIQNQIAESVNKAVSQSLEEQNKINEKIFGHLPDDLKQTLAQIFQRCNITAEFFINGVKSCFEMILKAFASKDLDTLKFLLSDKIYAGFASAIEARNKEQKNLNSNIISIDKAEVLSAQIVDNQAFVTVKITSKQINYFTNNTQEIIEGAKNEINELTDIWTFKKDLTAQNPNWIICKTS